MMLPMTSEGPSLKDTQLRISVTSLGKEKKGRKETQSTLENGKSVV